MGRIIRLDDRKDDKSGRMIRRPEYDDYDPMTGITERFYYDANTGDVGVEYVQDVELITEVSKASFSQFDERSPWKGDLHHVAHIPGIFLHAHPELLKDDEAVRKWCNNPDNRVFRTRPGKI